MEQANEGTDGLARGARCDIRAAWVLAGLRQKWAADMRYLETRLPVAVVARMAGYTARSLQASNDAGVAFRTRQAFGLRN